MTTTQTLSQEMIIEFVGAAHRDLARVKELYAENPAILNACVIADDETALQAASHLGQHEIARFLLDEGAPMNIFTAAMLGLRDEIADFFAKELNVAGLKGVHGTTLLHHAALSGDTSIAEMVVDHGGGDGIKRALHSAVKFNHIDMAKWLLAQGADVEVEDFRCRTALEAAVENNFETIATLIRTKIGEGKLAACPQCEARGQQTVTNVEGSRMSGPHTVFYKCHACGADMGSKHYDTGRPILAGK